MSIGLHPGDSSAPRWRWVPLVVRAYHSFSEREGFAQTPSARVVDCSLRSGGARIAL